MMDLPKPKNPTSHPLKANENGVGLGKDENRQLKHNNITTNDLKKEKYTKIKEKNQDIRQSPVKSKSSPYLSPKKTQKSPSSSGPGQVLDLLARDPFLNFGTGPQHKRINVCEPYRTY